MRSSQKIRIRAIVQSADVEQAIRGALGDLPELRLELSRETLQEHAAALAAPAAADLLIVDIDLDDPTQLLSLRHILRGRASGLPVIATSASANVEGLRQLMRLKITEYLPQPFARQDLLSTLDLALKQLRRGEGGGQGQCTVFSFIKPSGGMGATSLAIQTAFELSTRRQQLSDPRVCLVDLDAQYGNAAVYLDLEANLKLDEIARAPERLDRQLLQSMTSRHASGLDLLAAPNDLVELESIAPETVLRLLEVTCEGYDHVVIDLPQVWTRWSADVLAGSDTVFLVLQLSVAAVRQAREMLERLQAKDLSDLPLAVVLNRFERSFWRPGLRANEAERGLGRKIDHFIANDFQLVSDALNQGVPLMKIRRRNKIQKQVKAMVGACLARPARTPTFPSSKVVELLSASK